MIMLRSTHEEIIHQMIEDHAQALREQSTRDYESFIAARAQQDSIIGENMKAFMVYHEAMTKLALFLREHDILVRQAGTPRDTTAAEAVIHLVKYLLAQMTQMAQKLDHPRQKG